MYYILLTEIIGWKYSIWENLMINRGNIILPLTGHRKVNEKLS